MCVGGGGGAIFEERQICRSQHYWPQGGRQETNVFWELALRPPADYWNKTYGVLLNLNHSWYDIIIHDDCVVWF